VFTSDVSLQPDEDDELLTTAGNATIASQRNGRIDIDLDGDGVIDSASETLNAILVRDGRTGVEMRVESAVGAGVMRLVGAAGMAGDPRMKVVFREGYRYRAFGSDGIPIDLGFGCVGI